MSSRLVTGLEYDIGTLRYIQSQLVKKLVRLSQLQETSPEEASKAFKHSQEMIGAPRPVSRVQDKEAESEQDDASPAVFDETDQAKLSLADRTLVLAAMTATCTKDLVGVDAYCLLMASSGLVRAYNLVERDAYAKLSPALQDAVLERLQRVHDVLIVIDQYEKESGVEVKSKFLQSTKSAFQSTLFWAATSTAAHSFALKEAQQADLLQATKTRDEEKHEALLHSILTLFRGINAPSYEARLREAIDQGTLVTLLQQGR